MRQLAVALALAVVTSVSACGASAPEGKAPGGEAAPAMDAAAWTAHCAAVEKRDVDCRTADPAEARVARALCEKTQRCVGETYRSVAIAPMLACQEKADCDDDCQKVVAASLPPSEAEAKAIRACSSKFHDCDVCEFGKGGARALPDDGWDAVGGCFARAKSCDEALLCPLQGIGAALGFLGCAPKEAPAEFAAAMKSPTQLAELPEGPAIEAFAKTLPVRLGDPYKPKTACDGGSLTYAGIEFSLSCDVAGGKVAGVRFEARGRKGCPELAAKLIEDYGPPTRLYRFVTTSRVWKAPNSVLVVDTAGGLSGCSGHLAAKGSPAYGVLVPRGLPAPPGP